MSRWERKYGCEYLLAVLRRVDAANAPSSSPFEADESVLVASQGLRSLPCETVSISTPGSMDAAFDEPSVLHHDQGLQLEGLPGFLEIGGNIGREVRQDRLRVLLLPAGERLLSILCIGL